MSIQGIPGLLINNLWHLKQIGPPRGPWEGSDGSDAAGHAKFACPCYAARAVICDLSHDFVVEGKRTLRALFAEYAPKNDPNANNDPVAYANFLQSRAGVPSIDYDLVLFGSQREIDPRGIGMVVLPRLLKAMAEFEIVSGFIVPDDVIANGLTLYRLDYH